MTAAEGLCDGQRHLGFRLDDLGFHFRDAGDHFLFEGDGGGAADFRLCLGHVLVSLGLRLLEFGADVFPDIDVGDVDREDFERGAHIEAAVQRTPEMGLGTEIIFIEGHSTDDTWDQIRRVAEKYPQRNIKMLRQQSKGKGGGVAVVLIVLAMVLVWLPMLRKLKGG
jgi:hypothetical protein